MVQRGLVFQFVGIFTGILIGRDHSGALLASQPPFTEEASKGLHQEDFWNGFGQKGKKNSEKSVVVSLRPSYLEPARIPFVNSPSFQNDVVVRNMSSPEQHEINDMQKLPRTLDTGLAAEKAWQKQEPRRQRKAELCSRRKSFERKGSATGDSRPSRCESVFPREGPMGDDDSYTEATNSSCTEYSTRCGFAASSTASFGASTEAAIGATRCRTDTGRSRHHEKPQGYQQSGHDFDRRDVAAASDLGREREAAKTELHSHTQPFEQMETDEGESEHGGRKNQETGWRMGSIGATSHEQVPIPFVDLPNSQTRSDGSLQHEVEGTTRHEKPALSGITCHAAGIDQAGRDDGSGLHGSNGCFAASHCQLHTGLRHHGRGRHGNSNHSRFSNRRGCQGQQGDQRETCQGDHISSLHLASSSRQSGVEEEGNLNDQKNQISELTLKNDLTMNREVRFSTEVQVHVWHEDEQSDVIIPCVSVHNWLRSFWDLQAETCGWQVIKRINSIAGRVPWMQFRIEQQVGGDGPVQDGDNPPSDLRDPIEDQDHMSVFEKVQILVANARHSPQRSLWVETWYLNNQMEVCISSRRVVWTMGSTEAIFLQECRKAWQEFDTGGMWDFHFVNPAPSMNRDVIAHLIITQDQAATAKCMLLKHDGFPILRRYRAVGYHEHDSVLQLLTKAQCHRPCLQRHVQCSLQSLNHQAHWYDTEDGIDEPQAALMQAWVLVSDSSDDDDVLTDDGNPQSDSDVSTRLEEQNFENLLDVSDEEGDENMLMTSWSAGPQPVQFEFQQQYPFPWGNGHEQQEHLDDDLQWEHEALTFGHEQEENIHDFLEQFDNAELNPRGRMTAITFGIGMVDLGRRDITFDPRNTQSLVDTIAEIWHDHLIYANAEIWLVHPQPLLDPVPTVVLIVDFQIQHEEPLDESCALIIESSAFDTAHRQRPYAARLWGPATNRGLCSQLGLHLCHPMGVRNCDVSVAGNIVDDGTVIIPPAGALVRTHVHAYPEKIARVAHGFANVEEFFTRLRLAHESEHSPQHFCLRVHGISPRNRPLGHRDVYLTYDQFDTADWLIVVTELWPFGIEQISRLAFVSQLTQEHENIVPVLHLIINYARSYQGVPVLVRQTLMEQDTGSQMSELWAVMTRAETDAQAFRTNLQRTPFWMTQDDNIALIRDNSPLEEARTNWRAGGLIDLKIMMYDRPAMISWRIRLEGDQQRLLSHDADYETSSFLQKHVRHVLTDPFKEICDELRMDSAMDQQADVDEQEESPYTTYVQDRYESKGPSKEETLLQSLKSQVHDLLNTPWTGLNQDWTIFPDLHPAAKVAIEATSVGARQANVFHIYTDGSACKRGGSVQAAWAFVVACECGSGSGKHICRVGYAGDRFVPTSAETAALEAESMALIALADFVLSRPVAQNIQIHIHFDAKTVGFGATGQQTTIWQKVTHDSMPFHARVMLSLVQQKFRETQAFHVHGHDCNPFNELADGIARFIRCGSDCPIRPILRCMTLLQHPLKEFAWLEISPSTTLPDLETILQDRQVKQDESWPDKTLKDGLASFPCVDENRKVIDLYVATVNIGTAAYDQEERTTGSSSKVREILYQFQTGGYDIIGVQESRARFSRTLHEGPFVRLISAAEAGQGGIELWINCESLAEKTGVQLQVEKDCVVWHASARIMAVHFNLAGNPLDIIVVYGPQSGRPKDEISTWWEELQQLLRTRDHKIPVWVMGDFNAKIGDVTNDFIDDAGADLEDTAGEFLRELCQEHQLCVPSTFAHIHKGQHWTFAGPTGSRSRVDYFVVDQRCMDGVAMTFVDSSIDVLNGNRDHFVLAMKMQMEEKQISKVALKRTTLYDRQAARTFAEQHPIAARLPDVDWQCHVNEHWSHLRDGLQQTAKTLFPKPRRQRRQLYFSDATWDLVCQRKDLRILCCQKQRHFKLLILQQCFKAWKNRHHDNQDITDLHIHTLQLEEAMIFQQKLRLDMSFRQVKKQDWKIWVQSKLQEMVEGARNATCAELYKVLKPKAAIERHAGKHRRPLPGLKNAQGQWCQSKERIAFEWKQQFGGIEHSEDISLQQLQHPMQTAIDQVSPDELTQVPSLYDLEQAIRVMQVSKATGVDGVGAELLKSNVVDMAKKLYPLLIKTIVRGQWVPELSGGWLLPLFKGKGHHAQMSGYRAILLESTIARVFSRTWRRQLESGVRNVAQPNQWGGRRGLSCECLHLQVRTWQSNAKHQHQSLGLIFMDIRQAFYTLAKPLLTSFRGTDDDVHSLGQLLKIPASAMAEFAHNVKHSNLVQMATGSRLTTAMAEATLSRSWFVIPDGDSIQAPRTGSRPGDPLADQLFTLAMAEILDKIHHRLLAAELIDEAGEELTHHTAVWVDDAVFAVMGDAQNLVQKVTHTLAILLETFQEYGFQLSFGHNKTAVMFSWHGRKSVQARQCCDAQCPDGLQVFSEHAGMQTIPIVNHYKHLGGQLVRTGTLLHEIKTRAMAATSKAVPLRSILQNPQFALKQRCHLLRSMVWSVFLVHVGSWFDLNESEYRAWQGAWFRLTGFLHPRDDAGQVKHIDMYKRAHEAGLPMPMETIYLQRLRVCVAILQENDHFMIEALIKNWRIAKEHSWLQALNYAFIWMKQQISDDEFPEELMALHELQSWNKLTNFASKLKRMIQRAEKSHLLRVKAYCELKETDLQQQQLLRSIGWTCDVTEQDLEQSPSQVVCTQCGAGFKNTAALATHEQRKHGARVALRRLVVDGCCRVCRKQFHTRYRLIQHLHHGGGRCWIAHFRCVDPLPVSEADQWDLQDRELGKAAHHKMFQGMEDDRACRPCSDIEFQRGPPLRIPWEQATCDDPSQEELTRWTELGLLPPGQGGRDKTTRNQVRFHIHNVIEDTQEYERQMQTHLRDWVVPHDDVPRPLVSTQKYVLLFFAGNRRDDDMAAWISRCSDLVPISIDTAVHPERGNVFDDALWLDMIAARKIVGGHAGPPCESYTLARWIPHPGSLKPRPLRTKEYPWGLASRTLREWFQCYIGNSLAWKALILLLRIFLAGGAISLEHPRGPSQDHPAWCIWDSAFVRRMLKHREMRKFQFIQGPLGKPYYKPTTFLIGRMHGLPRAIYQAYSPGWRASMTLGGKDSTGCWKTSEAKQYPSKLCQLVAEAFATHADKVPQSGEEADPAGLEDALMKLTWSWDPYMNCQEMGSDFQPMKYLR